MDERPRDVTNSCRWRDFDSHSEWSRYCIAGRTLDRLDATHESRAKALARMICHEEDTRRLHEEVGAQHTSRM
jgi:hypothetical protein